MFVSTKYQGYNRSGQQSAGGPFLILLARDGKLERDGLRAVLRYVRMKQLGQFMTGSAQVGKHRLTLEGAYGNMGLPVTVDNETWQSGVPVPEAMFDAWNMGGGHNGVGTEAERFRQWALANQVKLQARKQRVHA